MASAGTATLFTSSGVTKSRPASAARQRDSFTSASEPARARADGDARALARRRDEVDDVAADALVDVHLLDRALHLEQRRAVDDLIELDLVDPRSSRRSSISHSSSDDG